MLRLSKLCLRGTAAGLTLVSLLAVRPIEAATIAYLDPAVAGNQSFQGSLGQNFRVNSPIIVTQLGVFDSDQDGIAGTLSVAIFSSTGSQVTPVLQFSGLAGPLILGDRFLPLPSAVVLAPGDYSLTTAPWGANLNGNAFFPGFAPPILDSGGGAITFTGSGFLTGGGLQYLPPAGLPSDQFNAGTFLFTTQAPEPASAILLAMGLLLLVLVPRRSALSSAAASRRGR
jgi:hypothetical protein